MPRNEDHIIRLERPPCGWKSCHAGDRKIQRWVDGEVVRRSLLFGLRPPTCELHVRKEDEADFVGCPEIDSLLRYYDLPPGKVPPDLFGVRTVVVGDLPNPGCAGGAPEPAGFAGAIDVFGSSISGQPTTLYLRPPNIDGVVKAVTRLVFAGGVLVRVETHPS